MVDFAVAGATPSPEARRSFRAPRGRPPCRASRSARADRTVADRLPAGRLGCRPLLAVAPELQVVGERAVVLEPDPELAGARQHDRRGVEGVLLGRSPSARLPGPAGRAPRLVLSSFPQPTASRTASRRSRGAERPHGDGILCAAVTRPAALVCLCRRRSWPAAEARSRCRRDQTAHRGAVLFNERCSGCHSLEAANSYGSKAAGQLQGGEVTNGPNFNVRKESRDDVLFAIRNGGFSGADHAGQHRGRRGRRAGRRLPRQVLRRQSGG